MMIVMCACGNEIYASDVESTLAWQCDACGRWCNVFGQEVPNPEEEQAPTRLFGDYDPDFEDME